MKDLEADNIIKAGTTSWFELNKEGRYVEVANFSVKENGVFYYGSTDLS